MGRSAGVRPRCSFDNGKNRRGNQLDGQAKSLTQPAGVEIFGLPVPRARGDHEVLFPDGLEIEVSADSAYDEGQQVQKEQILSFEHWLQLDRGPTRGDADSTERVRGFSTRSN